MGKSCKSSLVFLLNTQFAEIITFHSWPPHTTVQLSVVLYPLLPQPCLLLNDLSNQKHVHKLAKTKFPNQMLINFRQKLKEMSLLMFSIRSVLLAPHIQTGMKKSNNRDAKKKKKATSGNIYCRFRIEPIHFDIIMVH